MSKLPKLPITGSNVLVRHLEKKDLNEMYDLESNPDVKRYVGGAVSKSREEWVQGMENRLPGCQTLTVVTRDNHFVGRASISSYYSEEAREIQVVISKSYWSRHFGREVCRILIAAAFDELGAEQVIGVVDPKNDHSLKLLHLLGFEQTGVISESLDWQQGHLKFELPRSVYQKWAQP